MDNILNWYTDINSIVEIKKILELFSDRQNDICAAEESIKIEKYEEALDVYKHIGRMEKNNKNIALIDFKIADLHYRRKAFDDTIEICNKYNSNKFLLLKANSLGEVGRHREALILFNTILEEGEDGLEIGRASCRERV